VFYAVLRDLVKFLLLIVNGPFNFINQAKLPRDENYVLVAPHRTILDPVFIAIAARPKRFIFMAKKELFVPIFGWIIKRCGAFPIDRDRPGASALKIPVKELKTGQRSLIMFPTGTRHATDLKGGAAVIAKMAKVKIVPAVYQGPLTFRQLFLRKKVSINFGDPIDISDIKKMNEEGIALVSKRIQTSFTELDQEINPEFK